MIPARSSWRKTLAEQRGRHQGDSSLDVVEAAAAGERQLAEHERRPALGEHLSRLSDCAELTVAPHGRSLPMSLGRAQLQILQLNASSACDEVAATKHSAAGRGQAKGEPCTSSRFTRYPTQRRSGAGSWTCRREPSSRSSCRALTAAGACASLSPIPSTR